MDIYNLTKPIAPEEAARLVELYRYEVLNTGAEPVFDQIVQTAAKIFAAPIILILMVDLNEVFRSPK